MNKFLNRVRVATSTVGTGALTIGAVFSAAFMTPLEAGGVDGDKVRYVIEEGLDFEIGVGTLSATSGQLSRDSVEVSKIGGSVSTTKMNLGGNAVIRLIASARDYAVRSFDDKITISVANANALAVGPNGETNPTLQVDSSAASAATGIKFTAAAAGSRASIAAISSGANEGLDIDAKGSGTIRLGNVSTGIITTPRQLSVTDATASTSSTTGSATFGGGIGVAGSGYFGGKLIANSGADGAVMMLFSGATKGIRMGFTSTFSVIEGVDVTGTGSYQPLNVGGSTITFTVSSASRATLDSNTLAVLPTTASTSTTTGALTVAGGIGVAGSVYVGTAIRVGSDPTAGTSHNWVNAGSNTLTYSMYFNKSRDATNPRRWTFTDVGGLTTDSSGAAFWRGFHLVSPAITDPTGGATLFPTTGFHYEYNSLTAPTTRLFVMHLANTSSTAYTTFKLRVEGTDVITSNHLGTTIHSTTASTSATTGAFQVAGGIGVAGGGFFGDIITSAVNSNSGATSTAQVLVRNAHATGRAGLLVKHDSSSGGFVFQQVAAGQAIIQNTSGSPNIQFYDTTNNIFNIIGGATLADTEVQVISTKASTSSTTGAFKVAGGMGVAGAICAGGNSGIGSVSSVAAFMITKAITGGVNSFGVRVAATVQSDATAAGFGFATALNTQAASFTTNLYHYYADQGTIGAGSTATNQYGFYVQSTLTGATTNIGFCGNIAAGANRYNLYMSGTAANYLAGTLRVADTTASTSTTTGSLVVSGGAGFAGTAYIGGSLYVLGTSASQFVATSASLPLNVQIINNGNSGFAGLELYSRDSGGTVGGWLISSRLGASLQVYSATSIGGGYTEKLNIDTTGNVYAGSDNAVTLGTSSKRWSVVYAGTGTINTSDERTKDIVGEFAGVLDRARQIKIVEFDRYRDMTKTGEKTREFGVIAQDVRKYFPSMVYGVEGKEMLGITESKIGIIALAGLQELAPRVDKIESEIERLSAENTAFRAALEAHGIAA